MMRYVLILFIGSAISLFCQQSAFITHYEYWLNNDFESRTLTAIDNPSENPFINFNINVSNLPDGLHTLNLRFFDDSSNFSTTHNRFFIKLPDAVFVQNAARRITGYEYWENDNYENRFAETINPESPAAVSFSFDALDLNDGLNTLNIKFKDEDENHSVTHSRYFIKLPTVSYAHDTIRKIRGYEYWADDDFENRVSVSINPDENSTVAFNFDALDFDPGLHSLHIRFADDHNHFSPAHSRYFIKMPASTFTEITNRKVTGYRYWFNNNISDMMTIKITKPVDTLNLLREIAVPEIEGASIQISMQFSDEFDNWSPQVTKTFSNPNLVFDFDSPGLIQPENEKVLLGSEISFSWDEVRAADLYVMQISEKEDFSDLSYENSTIPDGIFKISANLLEEKTQYYWRVRARATNPLASDWPSPWSFFPINKVDSIEINLSQGWNAISSNVMPLEPNLTDLFAGQDELVLVKNASGEVFDPSQGLNQIGKWKVREGYFVYLTAPATLYVCGMEVNPSLTSIDLLSEWNFVPYLRNSSMMPQVSLDGISSSIIMLKNNAGQIYYPAYGINAMGDMLRGQAYWIYMNSADTLSYPEN